MVDPSGGQEDKAQEYVDRTYRDFSSGGRLTAFTVSWRETDLYIKAQENISGQARRAILRFREQIEGYLQEHPEFQTALEPLPLDPEAPLIVQDMLKAGRFASVGPMAAVAGAISEYVGRELSALSQEVIVENGGDIYLSTKEEITVSIFAGHSKLSMQMGLRIAPEETPCGVCTSSGTVGPSLSFGRTDALTVWAPSTSLADATATALANRIASPGDMESVLEQAGDIPGIRGVVAVVDDRIGLWGEVDIVRLAS